MRIASIALILAIAIPFAGGQQKEQTDKPSIVPRSLPAPADPWAVVSQKPVGRQSQRKSEHTKPVTPEAFSNLFSDSKVKPSLARCRVWISAATSLSDESLGQLEVGLYEEVPERLEKCVGDYPALSASDLRKAARAIYRFDQADENLFAASNLAKRKQLTTQQAELDAAKVSLAEVVNKYNALASQYNELNEANGQLFRTAQTLKLSVQQAQLDCASETSQAYQNGMGAARKLDTYTPPAQPQVCRTELSGWTLVTKCQ